MQQQRWNMNCARAIGLSHIKDHLPCQDNAKVCRINGVDVIALSDGCGSSGISEIGSQAVVDFVCEFLSNHFDELFLQDELSIKKTITNGLMEKYKLCLEENKDKVKKYVDSGQGRSAYAALKSYEIADHLDSASLNELYNRMLFDATVLFVAIKGNSYLIGHCGDGYILGIEGKKLVIVSEEPKAGPSNETTYPSTILAFEKAYKREESWDSFRVKKGESDKFTGFILMSDGAERSLVRRVGKESYPVLNNDSILFDIVANENEADATAFLTEILEKEYRQRENPQGENIEITDDDVSVAVMVQPGYVIDEVESPKPQEKQPQPQKSLPQNAKKEETQPFKSLLTDEQKKTLASMLGKGTTSFDETKYDWLNRMMSLALEGLRTSEKKQPTRSDLRRYLDQHSSNPIDDDDFKEIMFYLLKSGIVVKKVGGEH